MTRSEALTIVLDLATRYGENWEEMLPKRIEPKMTDEDIAKVTGGDDNDDYDQAIEIRDLWQAVDLIDKEVLPAIRNEERADTQDRKNSE